MPRHVDATAQRLHLAGKAQRRRPEPTGASIPITVARRAVPAAWVWTWCPIWWRAVWPAQQASAADRVDFHVQDLFGSDLTELGVITR